METKTRPLGMVILFLAGSPGFADPSAARVLSISQVLQRAENVSPALQAAADRERSEQENLTILKSFYYPSLSLEAIDSYGFSGSGKELGIGGLMGSPYRSGPAAGVTSSVALLDLGRRSHLEAARQELAAAQDETRIERVRLDQFALQTFLEAARFQGQQNAAREMAAEIERVQKEVDRFVQTGQRSVVEKLLVQDQTTDARMSEAAFHERYEVALERVALLTGWPAQSIGCPDPQSLSEKGWILQPAAEASPLLVEAAAEAAAAHAEVSGYSAQNWPKITATASVGAMDQSRVIDKKEYSGGFGLTLPLFAGYRISGEIRRARALASAKDGDLTAARMTVDELNAQYDETINASRVELDYLKDERDVARKAFALAKQRYLAFEGALVDVREALRNLSRVETEIINVQVDLLLAAGSKALINGGRIS